MITFSKLEKKGHLGNQLFQIASTIGIATSNGQDYGFPKWSYNTFFENVLPVEKFEKFQIYKEETFHFKSKEFKNINYDLEGWFQSEKYFDIVLARHYFEFKETFLDHLKLKFQFIFKKNTILISIRRGDFVDHPDYFQLPINYYIHALINNFPDWREQNLVFLSDDIDYCRFHFSFLDNVFFADNLSAIEQLGLASLCDNFIISNSTFSWWCAWLGEKKSSIIVRPLHYFTQTKNKIDNDKDYFPERWLRYNHLNMKMNLRDVVVVFKKENVIINNYLRHFFTFINEKEILSLNELNCLCDNATTRILFINDNVIPPFCIYNAVHYFENSAVFLKGNFINISKHLDYNTFKNQFDFGFFVKVLKHKMKSQNSRKLLFVVIPKNKIENSILLLKKPIIDLFTSLGFNIFYSFSGKVKNLFEFQYSFSVQKHNCIVFIKTRLKKIIMAKKI